MIWTAIVVVERLDFDEMVKEMYVILQILNQCH
jgi:hypothetical protein